jgi:hypothetical protein
MHKRFVGDMGEGLLQAQQSVTPGMPACAYAIAHDGRMTIGGTKTDAILVETGSPDAAEAYLFCQGYVVKKGWLKKIRVEKIGALKLVGSPRSRLWSD